MWLSTLFGLMAFAGFMFAQGGIAAADGGAAASEAIGAAAAASGDVPITSRLMSLMGLFFMMGCAWIMSTHRKKLEWRVIIFGLGLQFLFGVLALKTDAGAAFFAGVKDAANTLIGFTVEGSKMLFADVTFKGYVAFVVLPTIIFFSSLMSVLYHLGIMQRVVGGLAWVMRRTLRTSGAESLSAAGNIFVGQTEAPLLVRPYVDKMTQSELMAVMVGGFATVAGGVFAAYVGMLSAYFPDIAGHLLTASIMSAPAALVIAKLMVPETEVPETAGGTAKAGKADTTNMIDAAARGAGDGLTLALNVGAMLLAFIALVAMVNYLFAMPSYIQHGGVLEDALAYISNSNISVDAGLLKSCDPDQIPWKDAAGCVGKLQAAIGASSPDFNDNLWEVFTLNRLFGYLFYPFAYVMGVEGQDCMQVGQLLGTKMVLNEFVAYGDLSAMLKTSADALSPRSITIVTYALCGFANFGSIAIQIGGIGSIAPGRRADLAKLGVRAMFGGTLAAFMTACVAGILV
ncbi:MAG: NupC/NupG family nucleoside CNT transporter [Bradymonadia bacterium]